MRFTGSPLAHGHVHVWTVQLNAEPSKLDLCTAVLSDDERVRLERLKLPHLKAPFAVSHAALRFLLAHYIQCRPREVLIGTRPDGKPELANTHPLKFNMAHSGQLAAYAFAFDCEVGIDIETIRPLGDWSDAIARQWFDASEANALSTVGFFRCWTRKEAYGKALGTGLATPSSAAGAEGWTFRDIDPGVPGYTGALVYEGAMSLVTVNTPLTIDCLTQA